MTDPCEKCMAWIMHCVSKLTHLEVSARSNRCFPSTKLEVLLHENTHLSPESNIETSNSIIFIIDSGVMENFSVS